MGYGIIRVEKIKKCDSGAFFGRAKHNLREEREPENIDPTRTHKNKHFGGKTAKEQYAKLLNRWATVEGKIRDDAVGCLEVMITLSAEKRDIHEDYLKSSLSFISKMYGAENVISASIHLDETVPHLHAFVVPIEATAHKKSKDKVVKKRLSCQRIMGSPSKLRDFQDDFYDSVSKKFGLERGIPVEVTKAKNSRPTLDKERKELDKRAVELDKREKAIEAREKQKRLLETLVEALRGQHKKLFGDVAEGAKTPDLAKEVQWLRKERFRLLDENTRYRNKYGEITKSNTRGRTL